MYQIIFFAACCAGLLVLVGFIMVATKIQTLPRDRRERKCSLSRLFAIAVEVPIKHLLKTDAREAVIFGRTEWLFVHLGSTLVALSTQF